MADSNSVEKSERAYSDFDDSQLKYVNAVTIKLPAVVRDAIAQKAFDEGVKLSHKIREFLIEAYALDEELGDLARMSRTEINDRYNQ